MWIYEKKLEYPIKIKKPNAQAAKVIISQLGGPHGELGAATRYLNQRFAMPYREVIGILTDIGTEELAHVEMIGSMLYQLTKDLTPEEIKAGGLDTYFVDHTTGVYPTGADGTPFSAATLASTGDVFADLNEDLAAEQKARLSYDNILRLVDDPDTKDAIRFLREREIVHYQRFGDAIGIVRDKLDYKNFYAVNPAYDPHCK
ncbi:MAG: manganese catalase family protein [Clostridia bacterium]|nr:manganese catalase family protein [Clostridia bacterium]